MALFKNNYTVTLMRTVLLINSTVVDVEVMKATYVEYVNHYARPSVL